MGAKGEGEVEKRETKLRGIININKKPVSYKICYVFHQLCRSCVWCV